jgi:hypothetical protein
LSGHLRSAKSHRPGRAATIATGSRPSTRSNKPPWPGMRRELSFTPARRLSQLS